MINSVPSQTPLNLRAASPRMRIAALADADSVEFLPPAGRARISRASAWFRTTTTASSWHASVWAARRCSSPRRTRTPRRQRGRAAWHRTAVDAGPSAARTTGCDRAAARVGRRPAARGERSRARAVRALASLLDARADGIPVVAVGVGNLFGGTSVLACAADRLAMLPGTRIGLSGPKVLESVHGKWELDADDDRDVEAVFGAKARSAMGFVDLLADDGDALRGWVYRTVRDRPDFATSVGATHALLRTRIAGDPAHTTPLRHSPASTARHPSTMADVFGCATSAG
jgi:hypothetical protein